MRLDLWAIDCSVLRERHGEAVLTRGLDETLPLGVRPHAVLLYARAETLFDEGAAGAGAALLARATRRQPPTVLELSTDATRLPEDLEALPTVTFPFPGPSVRRRLWGRLVTRSSPLSRPDLDALEVLEVPGAAIDAAVRHVVLASGDERLETDALLAAARRALADPRR